MTTALFAPIPAEGDRLTLPNGVRVAACDVTDVPQTGETIITLGSGWRDPLTFYGVVTVDDLGTVTGTLDGEQPCPYSVGQLL